MKYVVCATDLIDAVTNIVVVEARCFDEAIRKHPIFSGKDNEIRKQLDNIRDDLSLKDLKRQINELDVLVDLVPVPDQSLNTELDTMCKKIDNIAAQVERLQIDNTNDDNLGEAYATLLLAINQLKKARIKCDLEL